ncbi:Attractin-like protein 1 [Armadillidium nasatum]|uniref:Attractin-like protein 1 n=1 Tax=Armadillidium nasatum TaxID=96803 RepID=A0A5N5SLD7_9CRUS|nr:Attractin-like protein 1 [Armadillidium nasatum]
MADLLKFLFKSKFMRKLPNIVSFFSINLILYSLIVSSSKECSVGNNNSNEVCAHGVCKDNYCDCQPGWSGKYCQFCSGRVRLWNESGVITDGSGNYSEDNQCTWLIDPNRPNSHIRLYLDHFATECSWDHLYIYDGGSIYDPLLAVFSGMIVQDHYQASRTPEVVAKSGKALLYFYSDAAYNLTGFSISYKLNGCPSSGVGNECSGNGVCIEGACTCDAGWAGNDCTISLCPSNCHGNGDCSMEKHRCLCHAGYTGNDCNQKIDLGWWESYPSEVVFETTLDNKKHVDSYKDLERASHSSIVIDEEVWIVGGYFFDSKSFILANNLTDKTLRTVEPISQNYPKDLYGHSSVSYNGSIFIFGGAIPNGLENNELWKFDPDLRTLKQVDFPSDSENPVKSNFRQRRDSGKVSKNFLLGEGSDPPDKKRKDKLSENYRKSENNRPSVIREDSCLLSSSVIGSCMPIGVVGHAAVVVKDMMLIIFGHSSVYGTLNLVQEYHFRFNNWKVIEAEGAVVSGTYGHTAVWDPETSYVYVHGGLKTATSSQVVAHLLAYDPFKYKWTLKRPAPLPRFLHSATLMPGLMLVFGGNTHNDTAFSYGAKCFSADFLAYDIHCDTWHKLDSPPDLRTGTSRYGHTSVNVEGKMVIFGGFNGRMLGTTLYYHLGRCDIFSTKTECLNNYPGQKCIWNRVLERCEHLSSHDQTAHEFCPAESNSDKSLNFTSLCNSQSSCHSCLYNSFKCVWCNNGCFYEKCNDYSKVIVSPEGCEDRRRWRCKSLRSCNLCHAYKSTCNWLGKECVFAPNQTIVSGTATTGSNKLPTVVADIESSIDASSTHNDPTVNASGSSSAFGVTASIRSCPVTCSQRTTCANCTEGPCMWCFNQQRCVNNNSYLVSFPYGQCREWTTEPKRCPYVEKGLSKCMVHQTCKRCQEHIGCGWCDDGSGTGTGICLEGGQSGPIDPTNRIEWTVSKTCPIPQWFFTSCPACQCNNHGVTCEHETGVCHCHTKGVTGDHCERCDTQNNYYGEPLKGSCFYDLQIDYQFTFNLSKQEDIHIRQINFYNVPSKSDVDTDFDIQCSKPARIKISARQTGSHETWIVKNFTGTSIKRRFSASEYVFGSSENNTTFHVYVFNFTPPIEIIISFSQHPKLDLIQFFSIFSLCFMVLLLMAFVMWKIKQKYDTYTRRQRLMVEMEAMASRPFRAIFLELQLDHEVNTPLIARVNNGTTTTPGEASVSPVQEESPSVEDKGPPILQAVSKKKGKAKGQKKSPKGEGPLTEPLALSDELEKGGEYAMNNPSPISLEPCAGNRAAVLSLLVELPTGNRRFTSPGHPGGLAVASALVSLGPPRKSSVEITATSTTTLHDPELGKKGGGGGFSVGMKNKFVSR